MKTTSPTPTFTRSIILISALTAGLFGCDTTENDTADNERESDSDDPSCGPAQDALAAEEFETVQWGGANLYMAVRSFQYFGECEFRCQSDFETLIWRVDPEGNQTDVFAVPGDSAHLWDVTPDGSRFAVLDQDAQILRILDAAGTEITTFDATTYTDAALSPDGTRVLLKSMGAVASDAVWTMATLSDNALREMTLPTAAKARYVSWSPDSTQLAYFDKTDTDMLLTVCNADDTSQVVLGSRTPNDFFKIVWRTDGQALFYIEYAAPADAPSDKPDGWCEIALTTDAAPVHITEALGSILSPDGTRTFYHENSWLSVYDISAETSVFSMSGSSGGCC